MPGSWDKPPPRATRLPGLALSWPVVLGFGVASCGGPLALVLLDLPAYIPLPARLLPLAVLLGGLALLPPLAIWRRYSARLASPAGLAGFVRAGLGQRWAWIQAGIWSVAYVLYLPYTIVYILDMELPAVLHLAPGWDTALTIALPVLCGLALCRAESAVLAGLAVVAALQLGALFLLAPAALHTGAPVHLLPAARPLAWAKLGVGAVDISQFFVCLSLVVFLGGEGAGGAGAIGRALGLGALLAWGAALLGALALAGVGTQGSAAAGWAAPGGGTGLLRAMASWARMPLGLLGLVSVLGVVLAEFVALARLWGPLLGLGRRRAQVLVGALFLLGDAVSLLGPRRFYALTLPPSLVALWLSLLLVFGAYPWYVRRGEGRVRLSHLVLAALACLWAGWGLYSALSPLWGGLPGG